MQEVLGKINELYTLLEAKIAKVNLEIEKQAARKKEQEKIEERQQATAKAQAAKERVLKKRDPFDKELAEYKIAREKYQQDKHELIMAQKKLASDQAKFEADRKDLDTMKAVYVKKTENLEKQIADLKEARKSVKFNIIDYLEKRIS